MDTEKLGEVRIELNPGENGGEAAIFEVAIYDNGDHDAAGIFTIGTVTLNSYGNVATMTVGNITPDVLRELADELEAKIAAGIKTFAAKRAFEGR